MEVKAVPLALQCLTLVLAIVALVLALVLTPRTTTPSAPPPLADGSNYNFTGGFLVTRDANGEVVETNISLSSTIFNASRTERVYTPAMESDGSWRRNVSSVLLRQGRFRTVKYFDENTVATQWNKTAEPRDYMEVWLYDFDAVSGPEELMQPYPDMTNWARIYYSYVYHDGVSKVATCEFKALDYTELTIDFRLLRPASSTGVSYLRMVGYDNEPAVDKLRIGSTIIRWHTSVGYT